MEQKKKRGRKPKSELPVLDSKKSKNGIEEGQYSKSTWNNGELVDFQIDWNRLSKIFDEMKKENEKN